MSETGLDRREFFRLLALRSTKIGAGSGLLYGALGLRSSHADHPGARGDLGIVRPPGALEAEADFLARCIRCTECADACEAQCIRLFGPEAGNLQGTPYIVPSEKGCTLCFACGPACPTEAITPQTKREEPRMGVAVVDERLCVSHNGSGVCGACHTVCPLRNRAIVQDYRNAPVVNEEACTGCGLCEEFCIVRDRRAIRVESNRRPPGEEVPT